MRGGGNELMPDSTPHPFRVLLLTDDDTHPSWTPDEVYVSRRMTELMVNGLREQNYELEVLPVREDLSPLDQYDRREWVIFNWVEDFDGRFNPEAYVAGQLEQRGFAFTGASSETLRCTQHRDWIKDRLSEAGLPVLPSAVLAEQEAGEWELYPAIVKGLNQHASTGITGDSIVDTPEQLAARIAWLKRTLDDQALVEPFLDTREFHVAVWGNEPPEAMPPAELDYSVFPERRDRLYTSDWKFDMHSDGYQALQTPCPAPTDDPALRARLEEIAVAAYQVTGLRDYGRMDLRMQGDTPMILDVNANPDLDPTSVHPMAAEVMGLSYGEMAARIVEFAAERLPK
jgi:D-alanine-D-alanine ligase